MSPQASRARATELLLLQVGVGWIRQNSGQPASAGRLGASPPAPASRSDLPQARRARSGGQACSNCGTGSSKGSERLSGRLTHSLRTGILFSAHPELPDGADPAHAQSAVLSQRTAFVHHLWLLRGFPGPVPGFVSVQWEVTFHKNQTVPLLEVVNVTSTPRGKQTAEMAQRGQTANDGFSSTVP